MTSMSPPRGTGVARSLSRPLSYFMLEPSTWPRDHPVHAQKVVDFSDNETSNVLCQAFLPR